MTDIPLDTRKAWTPAAQQVTPSPITLTLHADIAALVPARHLTTRDGSTGHANAGVTASVRPTATAAHLRDMAAWLTTMANARAAEGQP